MNTKPVLEIQEVEKHFKQSTNLADSIRNVFFDKDQKTIPAVDGVSLNLTSNQVQGVIGESGCGKTTLLLTLMGLHKHTSGSIKIHGEEVSDFGKKEWKEYRREVQLIFQDPFNALNPKMTIQESLREPLIIHGIDNKDHRIKQILKDVELTPPKRYLDRYPEQLSGGEKQRVAIGRALVTEPSVILADEPVSMLDVSTQASVLNLLNRLIDKYDTSMVYISHDLSTVSHICDVVNVMYLGKFVESAPPIDLIEEPKHPYTEALVNAIPIPDPNSKRERTNLEGSTPDPREIRDGCRFKNRCPEQMSICDENPKTIKEGNNRQVACHLYYDHEKSKNAVPSKSDDSQHDEKTRTEYTDTEGEE